MKMLELTAAYTVLKLDETTHSIAPLTEQIAPYIDQGINLILDVGGIQFDSMLIGEIVNAHRMFSERWADRPMRISMINLTPTSRAVFKRVRLDQIIPIFDTLGDAMGPRTVS